MIHFLVYSYSWFFSTFISNYLSHISIFLSDRNIFTTNMLIELISPPMYHAEIFRFNFFVVKKIDLIEIKVIVDKQILYWWYCCKNYMRFYNDIWNKIYLFFYKKSLAYCYL